MDDQLIHLYNQVKDKKISHGDALKEINKIKMGFGSSNLDSFKKANNNAASELFIYDEPFLRDHLIYGEQVLPGVTHASLAINSFFENFNNDSSVHIQRLSFVKPIVVPKDQQVEVKVDPQVNNGSVKFQIVYRYPPSSAWSVTAAGNFQKANFKDERVDINNYKNYMDKYQNCSGIYTSVSGITLGNSFKTISSIYKGGQQVLSQVSLNNGTHKDKHDYILHPLIINSAFLSMVPFLKEAGIEDAFLPFSIEGISCRKIEKIKQCWLHVQPTKKTKEIIVFDANIINDDFKIIAYLKGCSMKRLRPGRLNSEKKTDLKGDNLIRHHRRLENELPTSKGVLKNDDFRANLEQYITDKINKNMPKGSTLFDNEANLMDLGFESSELITLTKEIEDEANIELNPTIFFEYPNIKEITDYLIQENEVEFKKLLKGFRAKLNHYEKIGFNLKDERIENDLKSERVVINEKPDAFLGNKNIIEENAVTDIAVIGMDGRFGGAGDLDEFWMNLCSGKDVMKEIPEDHWDYRPWFDENSKEKNKTYCKWGSFIDDVDKFDATFFKISRREAEWMDPQIRLLLQSIYAAGENAGYINQLRGTKTGVFIGACLSDYLYKIIEENIPVNPFIGTGNMKTVIANRVSFFFDLKGPSLTVDTACSSSLIALHYACRAIKNKECDMAFVGGVNLLLSSWHYRYFSCVNVLSRTGRCHTFDDAADGYVPGECIASILLKPLPQAIKDGDNIHSIIKGSAVAHGGYTPSLTAPSLSGEKHVILKAWQDAQINPETLGYIEAHGTGTKLGDPNEINSVIKAFKKYTQKEQFCAIGSAKANIGHTEGAAGIAGVLKVILQIKNKKIPSLPQLNKLNSYIKLDKTPLYINRELLEWNTKDGEPRRAGVSSFGFAGAYAHVVIEEYIDHNKDEPGHMLLSNDPKIIILSAKNKECLKKRAEQLLDTFKLKQITDFQLVDLAYTLQVGREPMKERLALIVESVEDLEKKLKDYIEDKKGIINLYEGQVEFEKNNVSSITEDSEMRNVLKNWAKQGKYNKLINLWVHGMDFNWKMLYGDFQPKRMSLPTYPFAKERYWIPEKTGKYKQSNLIKVPVKKVSGSEKDHNESRKACFLKKKWDICDEMPRGNNVSEIAVLCNKDSIGLAKTVAGLLPNSEVVDISDFEIKNIEEQNLEKYNACIDLTGCVQSSIMSTDWIICLQKLIERGNRKELFLLCATKGLESFCNSTVNVSGACHAGLYRMLQSEYSHLRTRHLDLDPTLDDEALAKEIVNEVFLDCSDTEICLRKGLRYHAKLEEIEINCGDASFKDSFDSHVLWVTGGTRGLGLLCAQYFVNQHGFKRIVLTSRNEFPPKEQWEQLKNEDNSVAQTICAISEMENKGTQVRIVTMDLKDPGAIKDSVKKISDELGPIAGVLHCAGMVDMENPAFIKKSVDHIDMVLEPKIIGLENIFKCFKNEPLQFMILFSSVCSIIPTLAAGQGDYAMANAYMDYFAEANAHISPITSIQWPSWRDTGMGEVKSQAYQNTGLLTITNDEGLKFLEKIILNKIGPVVMPAAFNPNLWKPHRLMNQRIVHNSSEKTKAQTKRGTVTNNISNNLKEKIKNHLIDLFSKELKIESTDLDVNTPFQDFGVDSIMIAQILQQINKMVETELDPSILYEFSTIDMFANYLVEKGVDLNYPKGDLGPVSTVEINSKSENGNDGNEIELKTKSEVDRSYLQDIAVIGLSGRFPGACNIDEYWSLLSEGKSAIKQVPDKRWENKDKFFAGLIDDVNSFDPKFFLLPEEDVIAMDPQALMLLEETLKLWYHAGYSHQDYKGKHVGVYIGARSQHQTDDRKIYNARNPIIAVGQNYLAANISQYFDLRGPSVVTDSACSSALVAMNMAIHSMRAGEIECAIVGGISLLSSDVFHRIFKQRGLLSKRPFYHIFDKRSDGIVLGEGIGLVLLKTLEQAIKDGDQIYAVVKAVAVNNDGRTAGPATPNIEAQKEVMRQALAKSKKKDQEISYMEVNGSGSEVTDLLELKAIQSIYRHDKQMPQLGLGSIKPNIGHPLSAEGIASFIKVVLMLKYKKLVPFLSGEQAMEHYDMEASPFYFNRKLTHWEQSPRIAAINCFADGGTNAAIIIEAWSKEKIVKRKPISPPVLDKRDVFRSTDARIPMNENREYENWSSKEKPLGKANVFWKQSALNI